MNILHRLRLMHAGQRAEVEAMPARTSEEAYAQMERMKEQEQAMNEEDERSCFGVRLSAEMIRKANEMRKIRLNQPIVSAAEARKQFLRVESGSAE